MPHSHLHNIALLVVLITHGPAAIAQTQAEAQTQAQTQAEHLGYPANTRVLILHADDIGMCQEANEAARNYLEAGQIQSAAVMVPCPWFDDFAAWCREHPKVDVGLHLALTSEWRNYRWGPVTPRHLVPGLVDDDGFLFRSVPEVVRSASAKEIETEIRAQIDRALQRGIKPGHIDTHMGTLYAKPDYTRAYLKVAVEYDIPAMVIDMNPRNIEIFKRRGENVNEELIQVIRDYKLPKLDAFYSVPKGGSYEDLQSKFFELVSSLEPGITEIIFHPSVKTEGLRRITGSWQQRSWEARLFSDPKTIAFLKNEAVQFTNWKEMMRRHREKSEQKKGAARPRTPKKTSDADWSEFGPYKVGVRTKTWIDASRDDGYTEGGRTLITEIWYPTTSSAAEKATSRQTFAGFFGEHVEAAELFVKRVGSTLPEVEKRFHCVALRDTPVRPGKYPLLIFSHGNGGLRHQNSFQLDHLASHGYIIASPDHTGNAAVTPLPGKALIYDRKGRGKSAKDRPRDVSFLIDRLLEASQAASGPLAGRIDPERIGVLGHSFGGFTACRAVIEDERVKAILPMTVAFGDATDRPVMLMLGTRDDTMGPKGNAVARMYWMAAKGPKYLVELPRGGHFTFSDMDAIQPNFGDGIGTDPKTGETFIDTAEAKRIIRAYGLAFFERHLRESREAGEFLGSTPISKEVTVKREGLE